MLLLLLRRRRHPRPWTQGPRHAGTPVSSTTQRHLQVPMTMPTASVLHPWQSRNGRSPPGPTAGPSLGLAQTRPATASGPRATGGRARASIPGRVRTSFYFDVATTNQMDTDRCQYAGSKVLNAVCREKRKKE
ncbi:hypothetical protein BC828DRAFT_7666 [Blastocladiella britannica]|nr:hypothetical protein BC828DRAFT_7666 [Blastocladiella britannica]